MIQVTWREIDQGIIRKGLPSWHSSRFLHNILEISLTTSMLRKGLGGSGSGSNNAGAFITGAAIMVFTLAYGLCKVMFPFSTPYSANWTSCCYG